MRPALPRLDRDQLEPLGIRLCNWVGEVVLMMPTLRRLEDAGYQLHLVGRGWARALLEGTGWSVYKRPNSLVEARRAWSDLRRNLGPDRPKALLFTRSLSSALETRLAGWRPIGHSKDGRTPLHSASYPLTPYTHASRSIGISRRLRWGNQPRIRRPYIWCPASDKRRKHSNCLTSMACGRVSTSSCVRFPALTTERGAKCGRIMENLAHGSQRPGSPQSYARDPAKRIGRNACYRRQPNYWEPTSASTPHCWQRLDRSLPTTRGQAIWLPPSAHASSLFTAHTRSWRGHLWASVSSYTHRPAAGPVLSESRQHCYRPKRAAIRATPRYTDASIELGAGSCLQDG